VWITNPWALPEQKNPWMFALHRPGKDTRLGDARAAFLHRTPLGQGARLGGGGVLDFYTGTWTLPTKGPVTGPPTWL